MTSLEIMTTNSACSCDLSGMEVVEPSPVRHEILHRMGLNGPLWRIQTEQNQGGDRERE